jgi:hypothetical protein
VSVWIAVFDGREQVQAGGAPLGQTGGEKYRSDPGAACRAGALVDRVGAIVGEGGAGVRAMFASNAGGLHV